MMRCTVYHQYDVAGRVLYVGVSDQWAARMRAHERLSPWFDQIAMVRLTHCATREEALAIEAEAIRHLRPQFNRTDLPEVERWVEERCLRDETAKTRSADLWADYLAWTEAAGLTPVTLTAFGRTLRALDFTVFKDGRGRKAWRGLWLGRTVDGQLTEPSVLSGATAADVDGSVAAGNGKDASGGESDG